MLVTHEEVKAEEQLSAMLWDSVSHSLFPLFPPNVVSG